MLSNERAPVRAGDTVTDEWARHIYDGVAMRRLPRPEWTHQAHLVFATMLLGEHGLGGAEAAAPALIRAYNESVGGVNDDTQGYHHTITLFFLREIDAFMRAHRGENAGARATLLLASPLAATKYPLEFYSKELLFSVVARRGWVKPDIKELSDAALD